MKRILITGKGSYIGNSFQAWLARWPEAYRTDVLDMLSEDWQKADFSDYDAVVHCAGIVHVKETAQNRALYYSVNRDLAVKTAEKAKASGVRQFIYFSSMSVYNLTQGEITAQTEAVGGSAYGGSKLEAEQLLAGLRDDDFSVAILRPPMVYGPECKGNFQAIRKLAEKLPVFPLVRNSRSMLYIDNLCEFLRICVDRQLDGLFFPQNREYMNTTDMARWIAAAAGKNLYRSRVLGGCVWLLKPFVRKVRKAFGTLIYKDLESLNYEYCLVDNETSVRASCVRRS